MPVGAKNFHGFLGQCASEKTLKLYNNQLMNKYKAFYYSTVHNSHSLVKFSQVTSVTVGQSIIVGCLTRCLPFGSFGPILGCPVQCFGINLES